MLKDPSQDFERTRQKASRDLANSLAKDAKISEMRIESNQLKNTQRLSRLNTYFKGR
jgi:hypothetical protein